MFKAIINALDTKAKLYNNVFNIEEDNDLNIDTETMILGNVTIGSNLNVNNKLVVDNGSTTITSKLYISGDTTVYGDTVFTGSLFISGDTIFNNLASNTMFSDINVSGQAKFYETMTVSGKTIINDSIEPYTFILESMKIIMNGNVLMKLSHLHHIYNITFYANSDITFEVKYDGDTNLPIKLHFDIDSHP